ncbi:MAG: hypothetical protein DDT31_00729 [Syntrophomonadaceae bacterium]|nr:hypothetical protein [Bacillota bacterium]
MKKRRLISLVIITALVAITALSIIFIEGQPGGRGPFNLTRPQRRVVEIGGEVYFFLLFKYDPPLYFPPYLLESREEQDLSTPEGNIIATQSAYGRDREWYISLHDESAQKWLFKLDELSEGRTLGEYLKGTPLPNPLEETHAQLLHKVEFQVNNRKYAVIQMNLVFDGEVIDAGAQSFVKQDGIWLGTGDLVGNLLAFLVGTESYDELIQMSLCKETLLKLIFTLIIVILIATFFGLKLLLKKKAITG